MSFRNLIFAASALSIVLLSGCAPPTREQAITYRVKDAHSRLNAGEGGRLLTQAIEAHGGLEKWFSNGVLHFRWIYRMRDRGPDAVIDTIQKIDVWSARAVHEVPGTEIRFGWTGETAWILPADAEFSPPPHFWSLTPFYFVGVPFVLADPGTRHALLDTPITFEGKSYSQVKVTFEPGTGETPDDYYIVLIDPETHQVKGVRYIVTDPKLNPKGPYEEKLLTYEGYRTLNGIIFPTTHRSFKMNGDEIGEEIRDAEMLEVQYLPESEVSFEIPEGAKVFP